MRRRFALPLLALAILAVLDARIWAQDRPAAGPYSGDNTTLRGFIITLAVGDLQGGTSGDFSLAEDKALVDLRGFLPYKAYHSLDTNWIIGLNGPHLMLRGVGGQKHEFMMQATGLSPSLVSVNMLRLWDVQATDPHQPTPVLIDTTFRISVGETVVVGTSRLDGDRALILLVTAAAKPHPEASR